MRWQQVHQKIMIRKAKEIKQTLLLVILYKVSSDRIVGKLDADNLQVFIATGELGKSKLYLQLHDSIKRFYK